MVQVFAPKLVRLLIIIYSLQLAYLVRFVRFIEIQIIMQIGSLTGICVLFEIFRSVSCGLLLLETYYLLFL